MLSTALHVGNVIVREVLLHVSQQVNSLPFYGQNILVQLQKLYDQQSKTRQHYATLPGSMASYGKHTQTSTFENHANLLAYLGTAAN